MSTPCSSRWVAKLCRSVWGDTRLEIPARSLAAVTARLSWRGGHRIDRVLAGKQPDPRPRRLPPFAQEFEQLRRQHHVAIPLTLALLDPKRHAPTVDVGHLQVRDLGHPEARAVGDAERGLVLEARRGLEETRHLLLAQHDRRLARRGHDPQRANEVGPFERHGEEEPQRGDGGVDRRRADLLLRHDAVDSGEGPRSSPYPANGRGRSRTSSRAERSPSESSP